MTGGLETEADRDFLVGEAGLWIIGLVFGAEEPAADGCSFEAVMPVL